MSEDAVTPDPRGARTRALSRRGVLRGIGVGGLALPLLAACAGDDGEPSADATDSDPSSPESAEDSATPADSGGNGDDEGGNGGSQGTTVAAADVPVGGGTILAAEMVVVTQPSEGDFKAFSARCTHQGCPVQTVSDGQIGCNCHGSAFSIEDGAVVTGPAERPLESIPVSVDGDQVVVG